LQFTNLVLRQLLESCHCLVYDFDYTVFLCMKLVIELLLNLYWLESLLLFQNLLLFSIWF
jgi:hypothetical protein